LLSESVSPSLQRVVAIP